MPRRTVLLIVSLAASLAIAGAALASKPPKKPGHPQHPGHPNSHHTYAWHDVTTGTTAHLRGLSAVSANEVWTSGYTSTGEPICSIRPLAITASRSLIVSASSWSWVT